MFALNFSKVAIRRSVLMPTKVRACVYFAIVRCHIFFDLIIIEQLSSFRTLSVEVEYQKEVDDVLAERKFRAERKQALIGIVSSTKCSKSVTVVIEHDKYYSKYNKYVKVQRKVMAHDEEETGKLGDIVRIVPCRPMSRRKRHKLMDVIRRLERSKDGAEQLLRPYKPKAALPAARKFKPKSQKEARKHGKWVEKQMLLSELEEKRLAEEQQNKNADAAATTDKTV